MAQLALDTQRMPTNQGFVTSLERTGRGLDRPAYEGLLGPIVNWWKATFGPKTAAVDGLGPLAMLCQPSSHVPVLSQLALNFALCTRWFCSVPGETWPNRNFLHAATSDGETDIDIRFYDNPTIFELLEKHDKTWHIYYDDTPQVWAFRKLWDTPERHANWFVFCEFLDHVAAGQLPSYSFIVPNHRPPLRLVDDDQGGVDTPDVSNNQHPENNLVSGLAYEHFVAGSATDFSRAESLIATVYEALRANPALFERSVLLVTYDEHGGFYDHEPPPVDAPNPGTRRDAWTRLLHLLVRRRSASFDFTMLGPRVPAVVISPYVPRGALDETLHEHSSVPRTLRQVFAPDSAALTARDAWAQPFHTLLSLVAPRRDDLPDLSAYVGPAAPTAPATPATTGQSTVPVQRPLPPSYQAFVAQAEKVHQHLVHVHEDEAATPLRTAAPDERAAEITQIFTAAAQRHREEQQGTPARAEQVS